ncbi:hypothetical protein ACFLU5_09950 [Bacteroidota bacterium]
MRGLIIFSTISFFLLFTFCTPQAPQIDDFYSYVKSRSNDLRLSTYVTAQAVERLFSTVAGRREAISILRANGIDKVYIEVYRSGLVVSPESLQDVTKYFTQNGFEVVGGIATVPGTDFGVRQEARYGWFNWQNEKTQKDLLKVMVDVAPIFDSFIVDDFLCTDDTSAESNEAKGEKSWSLYRRELLTELQSNIFIDPVKKINPDINMIIKYPQWYDRFHLFGYDVVQETALYDQVWVGTETRNMNTQRFGFVQPYEGFVNYRWLASISGNKIGGSWFDHIECDRNDFYDQAWQSVLAGSQELCLFNYFNITNGHEGHHLLRLNYHHLADLAKTVKEFPVVGVSAYKPPNSNAGGDLYVMDFIGMFGIPLIPVSQYPEEAGVIFLPTQAAEDPDIFNKVQQSLQNGARIIITAGFLASITNKEEIAELAGVEPPGMIKSLKAQSIISLDQTIEMDLPLEMETILSSSNAEVLLEAVVDGEKVPYLTQNKGSNIFVLNSHTFSQADFDAVGEVLLCPKPLGMLQLPIDWANIIRNVFNSPLNLELDAPVKVSMQTLANGDIVVHNYNSEEVSPTLKLASGEYIDKITGKDIAISEDIAILDMPARSRMWIRQKN